MMKANKSRLRVLISIFILITFAGCSRPSDIGTISDPSNTKTNDNLANLNTNSSGPPGESNLARLDRFVGSWGGYAARSTVVSGKAGIDSRWMNVNAKRVTPDAVGLEGDVWQTKASLKYDKSTEKYFLSIEAEDFPRVAELPMTFSETEGFSGETTFKYKGKEYKAKATIKDNKGASEWHASVTQGKDLWNLTIRLGKEQQ